MCLQYKSFENTEGKGEIARNFRALVILNMKALEIFVEKVENAGQHQFRFFTVFFLPYTNSRFNMLTSPQVLLIWKGIKLCCVV